LASGLTNVSPLTGAVTESPFLNANTGNTAYGIQYSSQYGNNGNQRETYPATVDPINSMAFFVVKFDAGNRLTIYIYIFHETDLRKNLLRKILNHVP